MSLSFLDRQGSCGDFCRKPDPEVIDMKGWERIIPYEIGELDQAANAKLGAAACLFIAKSTPVASLHHPPGRI
jgi:hypothetical protein